MSESKNIRVLIIDDSALMRAMIRKALDSAPGIEVIDAAGSGPVALEKIKVLKPDVATLDVEMPGMDGIELLRRIMAESPIPVVMLSAHTYEGASRTFEALENGAVDCVAKPTIEKGSGLREVAEILADKIRTAATANIRRAGRMARPATLPTPVKSSAPAMPVRASNEPCPVIAIGISCGGPATLAELFPSIPADAPPILITQHMPPKFTKSLADRLDRLSALTVVEGADGLVVQSGHAYIAPGDAHMRVVGKPGSLRIKLDHGERVCGHKPSADVMLRSVALACGSMCVGIIMTGMGNDGAEALGEIKRAGGFTMAQDQESCVVYGMPKAAVDLGNAIKVVSSDRIIPAAIEAIQSGAVR